MMPPPFNTLWKPGSRWESTDACFAAKLHKSRKSVLLQSVSMRRFTNAVDHVAVFLHIDHPIEYVSSNVARVRRWVTNDSKYYVTLKGVKTWSLFKYHSAM